MKRAVCIGGSLVALLTAAGLGPSTFVTLAAQAKATPTTVAVDPLWPKPFPQKNAWILGSVTGVAVDAPGSRLGRASRRRFAADQRERAGARAVGELVLLCRAAGPRVRRGRHAARALGSEDRHRLRLAASIRPASPSTTRATCGLPAACRPPRCPPRAAAARAGGRRRGSRRGARRRTRGTWRGSGRSRRRPLTRRS